MKVSNEYKTDLFLSAQGALIGLINKNIKSIAVDFTNGKLDFTVYFYKAPDENEKEDMRVVTTEMVADFPDEIKDVNQAFIAWDGKTPFNTAENLVFLRKD